MINIQTGNGSPEVSIDRRLMPRLKTFEFDPERFAAGLELLDVPATAIDSLDVRFKNRRFLGNRQAYVEQEHRLDVGVPGQSDFDEYREFSGVDASYWADDIDNPSTHLNYRLALTAYDMAATILKKEDQLTRRKLAIRDDRLVGAMVLTPASIGALIGIGMASSVEHSQLSSGLVGFGAGAFWGTVGVAVSFGLAPRSDRWKEISALVQKQDKRAKDFVHSRAAYEAFNGVVKIELLK